MKQNYYEILEVDKNASPEIIKKAYATLAKKYHPDLQDDNVKHLYEEKLKLINEAYETLSDAEKRENYNHTINAENILLEEQINILYNENQILRKQITQLQSSLQNQTSYRSNLNNYYAQNYNQNSYNYVNYNEQPTNNTYKKNSNIPFHNLFKSLISLGITCMFFYFMLKIIFAFSYLKNSP